MFWCPCSTEMLLLGTSLRNQIEALFHSMWVLTGLSLVRQAGFVPKDLPLPVPPSFCCSIYVRSFFFPWARYPQHAEYYQGFLLHFFHQAMMEVASRVTRSSSTRHSPGPSFCFRSPQTHSSWVIHQGYLLFRLGEGSSRLAPLPLGYYSLILVVSNSGGWRPIIVSRASTSLSSSSVSIWRLLS